MRVLSLLALLPGLTIAQSNRTACSLSPVVEKEHRALPPMSNLSLAWEERMAPRRTLAKQYPSDWVLQISLQDSILRLFHIGREWDRAIAEYRALPDRALGELLEARLLSGLHRQKSGDALKRLISQVGDAPWTHLSLLEWAANTVDGDPALAEREFEEFRRMCPQSTRAYSFLEQVRTPDRRRRHITDLRNVLEDKKKTVMQEEDLSLFRVAWTWERGFYGEQQAGEFERLVRSDLGFLRDHPMYEVSAWYSALRFGYEQTLKDSEGLKSLQREVLAHAPKGQAAYWILQEQERQRPPAQASREEVEAYNARMDAAGLERVERFWGQPYARFDAQHLLTNPRSTLPVPTIEHMADYVLAMTEQYPDQGASWPPAQILIAEVYVNRQIRLGQVPALLEQGLEQIEYQEKHRRDSDLLKRVPASPNDMDNVVFTQNRAREIFHSPCDCDATERTRSFVIGRFAPRIGAIKAQGRAESRREPMAP